MDIFGPGPTTPGAATLGATLLSATPPRATTPGAATPGAATSGAATLGAATPGTMAPPPSAGPDAPLDPKIWQAAQNFEAMAIGQMLAPMFDTVDLSKTKFGGGQGEAAFKPMMIDAIGKQMAAHGGFGLAQPCDAIGKQMAAHGGFGLAQPIYAAMLRAQEGHAQQGPAQAGQAQPGASVQPSTRHATHQPGKTP
jgi:flagellar protein FlgJ